MSSVSAPKICPICSAEYPDTERFCPKDGTALRAQSTEVADLVGSVIADRYHVLSKLGQGGMGQVYLAEHVKMGRLSAVKVMNPAMVHDTGAINRFNREAANASRIDHPNVAAIYDFGETPEGLVYLAMQYVEGETLTQIMQRAGALPPLRAADITRQAAEGLHAAHGLGIVHRDLKPDNIMVTKDRDGHDCVKVVDFGIAKAATGDAQQVTKTGVVVGTPEYMSPEQLTGEEVDGRSDVYSLALVAFHMLSGSLPFLAASTQTSIVMRLTDEPKSLAEVKPDVPWTAEVQAVMSMALARKPGERHATAREFGRALHAAIERMPQPAAGTNATVAIDAVEPAPAPDTSAAAPRAAPSTARAAPPAPTAPKQRELTIAAAAAGVLVVIAIVAVMLMRRGGGGSAESSPAFVQGVAAYREGRREEASQRFRAAVADAPDDPMPHVYLARIAREGNDLVTANTEAVMAVQLGPENGAALRELASISFVQQNFTGARTFYARAIKADPNDRLSQGYLGCSLMRLGRAEEGMRWLQRAGAGPWSGCAPAPSSR